jgi:hypothetical protein
VTRGIAIVNDVCENAIVLRSRLVATLCAASVMVSTVGAYGDPSASDKETARALMKDGEAKRSKGDHQGALQSFKAAHAIMNVPTTGLELGRTQNELGLLVESRDTLLAVTRMPVVAGESEQMAAAREEAQKLADTIEPRIPSLTVKLEDVPSGATPKVTIDGVAILPATVGLPRKHNPGKHEVVVAAGSVERRESVTLAEGEEKTIAISLAEEESLAPRPSEDKPSSRVSPLVYVGFGSAAAFAIVGGVTGVLAFSRANRAKEGCDGNLCPPETHEDVESSRTFGTISTISFALAGAGAIVGVIGLMSKRDDTARVRVYLGVASLGVVGRF